MKRKVTTEEERKAKELKKAVANAQRLLRQYEQLPDEAKALVNSALKTARDAKGKL